MKHYWENDGEPNEQGQYHAVVDLEDGSQPQHFYGATHKDVADKLLQAQANASKRIRELKTAATPEIVPQTSTPRPRTLSADEQFRIAQEITDPEKAPGAIRTVVEAATGVPLDRLAERFGAEDEERAATAAAQATREFVDNTPEFYPCSRNNSLLLNFMRDYVHRDERTGTVRSIGLAFTRRNLQFAFEQLQSDGLLTPAPATTAASPAGEEETSDPGTGQGPTPATGTRPRGAVQSTGIRNGDSSGVPGRRTTAKYTRADIEAMSEAEYASKIANEPGFAQLVDSLYRPAAR